MTKLQRIGKGLRQLGCALMLLPIAAFGISIAVALVRAAP